MNKIANATLPVATWGQVIRAAREKRGVSLRKLAAQSGVTANSLHNIEKDRWVPRMSTVQQIAGALELKVSDLMRDVDHSGRGIGASGSPDEDSDTHTSQEEQSVRDFVYAMLMRLPEERRTDWVMDLAAEVKAAESAAKRGKAASDE